VYLWWSGMLFQVGGMCEHLIFCFWYSSCFNLFHWRHWSCIMYFVFEYFFNTFLLQFVQDVQIVQFWAGNSARSNCPVLSRKLKLIKGSGYKRKFKQFNKIYRTWAPFNMLAITQDTIHVQWITDMWALNM